MSTDVEQTEALSIYLITVYAALSLYRDAQTWRKVPSAEKARANLKLAVSSLNNAPVVAVEIKFNHQVVTEMRDELKVPRPSTEATVSDQAVSTVSAQPGATDQAVSTSSAAPVSDQPVSTGSAPEGSARSVLMSDLASGGTHAIEDTAKQGTKRPTDTQKAKPKAAAKGKQSKSRKVATEAEAAPPVRRSARLTPGAFIPTTADTRKDEDDQCDDEDNNEDDNGEAAEEASGLDA